MLTEIGSGVLLYKIRRRQSSQHNTSGAPPCSRLLHEVRNIKN